MSYNENFEPIEWKGRCPECGGELIKETNYCDFCQKDFPYKTDWSAIARELLNNRLASNLNTYYNPSEVRKELRSK